MGGLIPELRSGKLMVDGKEFLALAGELHNSSSSSLEYMASIWPRLVAMNLNTVLAPISWELLEPQEGTFDWTLVDGLINGARNHGLRLVPLWFGSFKNGQSTYVPGWIKVDTGRFPRAQTSPGVPSGTLSPFGSETLTADKRAFAALMRRIREVDYDQTVILVQVENESGLLGGSRDLSPLGEEAWQSYLAENADTSEERFMAHAFARFVGEVASTGKSEYSLPMFANAWLVNHPNETPGQYPSGGPVPAMLDLWHASAPCLDALAPDIYYRTVHETCKEYKRSWNPLLIPEIRPDMGGAASFFAIAQADCVLYSPFAIDGATDFSELADAYALIRDLTPLIVARRATGRMAGILHEDRELAPREISLGGYRFLVKPHSETNFLRAHGLLIEIEQDEFLLAGCGFDLEFSSHSGQVDFLWIEEGRFVDGSWLPGRRLNGDEYHLRLGEPLECRRFKLYRLS
jgi:hypothetical protein